MEGVVLASSTMKKHFARFPKNKGLYIIGNDNQKMLETVKKLEAEDVQIIGLVPNVAHGLHRARQEQGHLNNQHLQRGVRPRGKKVGAQGRWQSRTLYRAVLVLHQVGRARGSNKPLGASSFLDSAYMLTLFRLEVFSFPKIQRLFWFSSYFHGLLEKVAKASL